MEIYQNQNKGIHYFLLYIKCQSRRNQIKDTEEKLDFIDKSDKNDQTILERRILKQKLDILCMRQRHVAIK